MEGYWQKGSQRLRDWKAWDGYIKNRESEEEKQVRMDPEGPLMSFLPTILPTTTTQLPGSREPWEVFEL